MIKVQSRVNKPDDVELTLTVTMPVREWREQMRQLPREYPSWKLGAAIAGAIGDSVMNVGAEREVQ